MEQQAEKEGPLGTLMVAASVGAIRISRVFQKARDSITDAFGGILEAALSPEEQSKLAVRLYDHQPGPARLLRDWERAWFEHLPMGDLLLGGAGAGREAVPLAAEGRTVWAYEPADGPARVAERRLGREVVVARHQDLARAVHEGQGPALELASRRYDAILLGWGSLTMVADPIARNRVMRACAALTDGPIFASVWLDEGMPDRTAAAHKGRSLGQLLGKLRRLPQPSDGLRFAIHCGFGHAFTRDEVEALGRACNREVIWDGVEPCGHVRFVRKVD